MNSVIRRLKLSSKDQVDKPCRVVRGPSHLKELNVTSLRSMLTSRVDLSLNVRVMFERVSSSFHFLNYPSLK